MRLRPFFSFYGSKWRTAHHYPRPHHPVIIEPFAGSAGYAGLHCDRRVILVDADPVIAGLWAYLINVRASEIRALPGHVDAVDDVQACAEARWLIGFWLARGTEYPRKTPSAWMRQGRERGVWLSSFWCADVRDRIAAQVERIRHWKIIEAPYDRAPDVTATWFIDPPYVAKGRPYRAKLRDHAALGLWCRQRSGQVIACEQHGADWLPFETLDAQSKSTRGTSHEVIWYREDERHDRIARAFDQPFRPERTGGGS